jgi:hypothetical protein
MKVINTQSLPLPNYFAISYNLKCISFFYHYNHLTQVTYEEKAVYLAHRFRGSRTAKTCFSLVLVRAPL